MRSFLAYPEGSPREPYVVVRLDAEHPTPHQIRTEAARLFRRDGHDVEADNIDFHSVT